MTEEEFFKKRFKPLETMVYENTFHEFELAEECMCVGIDFENKLFKLRPFSNSQIEEKAFWSHCDYVNRPKPKMKKI